MSKLIRAFDIFFATAGLLILLPFLLLFTIICYFDTKSPFFVQQRLGLAKKPFYLIKFRTMHVGTDSVPTHLVDSNVVTNVGKFLRRSKIDELPQLYNVLVGEMSLVGPRPCLPTQTELINEREFLNVFNHLPGITGLAQIRHIDMSTPKLLANADADMLVNMNIFTYFSIIFMTIFGRGAGDRIVDIDKNN